jgi:hypothetical protein
MNHRNLKLPEVGALARQTIPAALSLQRSTSSLGLASFQSAVYSCWFLRDGWMRARNPGCSQPSRLP